MIPIIILFTVIFVFIFLSFILPPKWTYENREKLIEIDFKRFQTLYQANPEYWCLDTDGVPVYNNFKGQKYFFKFNTFDYYKYQFYAKKIRRNENGIKTTEYALKAFKQIKEDLKEKQQKDEAEIKKQLEKCYPSSEYEIVFLDDVNRAVVVNKTTIKDIEN